MQKSNRYRMIEEAAGRAVTDIKNMVGSLKAYGYSLEDDNHPWHQTYMDLKNALSLGEHDACEDKPSERYTVLLLYPDYAANNYGLDTYLAHVETSDGPQEAVNLAAAMAEADNGGLAGKAEDFHCLLCIAGHHEDLGSTPVLEIVKEHSTTPGELRAKINAEAERLLADNRVGCDRARG